jgi:hypothetical protein
MSFDNLLIIGDMNYDLFKQEKSKTTVNIMDSFDLVNLVKKPTCHKNVENPSLIDVILTNSPTLLCNTSVFNCSISDCHSMIFTSIKEQVNSISRQKVTFRSYKNFNENQFNLDLQNVPFDVAFVFDDIDDTYWAYEKLFTEVLDEHAPVKQKYPRKNPPPYMNSEYRKIIYKTRMAHNTYLKHKTSRNWDEYKKLRNLKTKAKRESIKTYFFERCGGGPKSKDFWPTIKPFLSKKSVSRGSQEIIIKENENLISNQSEVCEKLNDFYVNIAKNIGIDVQENISQTHPSVSKIIETHNTNNQFHFQSVTQTEISKSLKSLNPKKATGVDNIPPKILNCSAPSISVPLTRIVNKMIETNIFPDDLKKAQVTPLYKKDDPFVMKNYRPVSILSSTSKVFEKVINDQLCTYFDNIFHNFLAAFRPKYGCQTTLLRLIEDWKMALDNNEHVGAILMDLSKAFDCLPHNLIALKLKAYGLSDNSVSLVHNYLTNRKQRVKIGKVHSSWTETIKGVPQGSILGPLIFNIFINDIFYFIEKSSLYNYADDNTLSFNHPNICVLKSTLEQESKTLINWFNINQMQANPDKFQSLAVGKKTHDQLKCFNIDDVNIACEDQVKLLGVDLDFLLNFDAQITRLCKKAAGQLNVLLRLSKFLSVECKLLVYKSFIRSNFSFCPIIWHFCSKQNTEKLEKLQHRALRIVFNDFNSTYEDLLEKVNMPTLHLARLRTIAIETYKCLYRLSPPYLHDLVEFKQSTYTLRNSNTILVPKVRTTTYGKKSFRFEAARVWNNLPNHVRTCDNYKEFTRMIQTWTGQTCTCVMCKCI